MDIVDINKVLDDLELNEEQHSKLNRPQENEQNNILNNLYTYEAATSSPHPPPHQMTTASPPPPPPNRTIKKNFVNVSNVFNSLNEYVNAGIDTVKLPERSTLPTETYNNTSTNLQITTATVSITSDPKQQNDPDNQQQQQSIGSTTIELSNNEMSDATSSLVNNFSEETSSTTNRSSEYSAINEQVTDSVSNTLFSGDSDDGEETTATTTEQSTIPIQSEQSERIVPQLEVNDEIIQNIDNNQMVTDDKFIDNREIDKEENVEEQNDDDDDGEEDVDEGDEEQQQQQQEQNAGDNVTNENNQLIGIASKSSDRFIKPISFETAATMDDVSDTELESYLQELEELEESAVCDVSERTKDDDKPNEILENCSDINQTECIEQNMENTTGDLNQITSIPNDITTSNVSNSNNSTIDDDNDNDVDENLDSSTFHPNPPNTTENNLNFIGKSDDFTATETNLPTNSELTENFSSDSEQQQFNCSESEQNQSAPKRPNTLDLPSVINISHDETIDGDTPATGQMISSSLSSSNSDMLSQLTPLNDSSINPTPESSNDNVNSDTNESNAPQLDRSTIAAAAHLINSTNISINNIGKVQPYWIPDSMTMFCMQCNQKFSFIKRRHHCRACGLVLCSACCSLKSKLEYLGDAEARICIQCDILLNDNRDSNRPNDGERSGTSAGIDVASVMNSNYNGDMSSPVRSPNPNNPMEYCSVIPPYQQVASSSTSTPISVMVPVGVLKREGVSSKSQRKEKNVMFSDGIRPGCDLTDLDNNWDARSSSGNGESSTGSDHKQSKMKVTNNLKLPIIDAKTNSYIPSSPGGGRSKDNTNDVTLPPICLSTRTEFKYAEVTNNEQLIERLQKQQLKFMIQRNFYVLVKLVKLTCCINKLVINFTTHGMHLVGQDEIVILLEMDSTNQLPKDIFLHLNDIYRDADKGQAITELGFSMANTTPFLGSKEHGGFLFIRTTFQCMQNIIIPDNPYLIGILIHRWEVPWAKIFPLRLMLRLGALHRYYPSPHVSVRYRNSVYAEIAQTIINFLADFRTYSYTLPTIRGMYIHMEDRRTNVLIPRNRYDQIMKALNNSSDHIIALAGNFSKLADGHLVCVQNTDSGCAETHAYSTQAINIQGKPRKVTGASFFVLNGALKTTSGLSGKCSIVEDGLMVQILPKKMTAIQQALKTMKDIDIVCGPVDGDESQTELVCIQWVENDTDFNVGVVSPIDKKPMDGVPSIRVHHGMDFANSNHTIRWTEVFILKSDDESAHGKDPIDMSKLSEQIARSASVALVSFLDLLATSGLTKLAIRATLDQDQVCYEAGSNMDKLAPLYMNALDNELIPTLHRQATNLQLDQTICLELIFHILDV